MFIERKFTSISCAALEAFLEWIYSSDSLLDENPKSLENKVDQLAQYNYLVEKAELQNQQRGAKRKREN